MGDPISNEQIVQLSQVIKMKFAQCRFIKKLAQLLPKGEFGRNILAIANSNIIAQGLSIFSAPISTRLYTPEDYGTLAVFSAVLSILTVAASLRYDWTLPMPKDEEDAVHLLALSLLIVVILGIVLGGGIALTYPILRQWNYIAPIYPYLWLLPIGLWGAGSYQVFSAWIIRRKDLRPLAKTRITQSLSGVIVKLTGGAFKVGAIGLIVASLVAQAAGVQLLAKLTWQKQKAFLRAIRFRRLRLMARRYAKTALFACGASFLNTASLQVTPLLFAAYYNTNEVGWFALSQRVVGMPVALIGRAVAQAFWSEAARLVHDNPQRLRKLFFQATKRLAVISLLIGLLAVVSPWFFGYVFGKENWQGAGVYTLYLAPFYMAQVIVSPISHLVVHEKQHWQFWWDLSRLLLVLLEFTLGSSLGWSASQVVILYSFMMALMYIIVYWMNLYALRLRVLEFQAT